MTVVRYLLWELLTGYSLTIVHSCSPNNRNKRAVSPGCPLVVKGPLNRTSPARQPPYPAILLYMHVQLQDQQRSYNGNLVTKLQLFRIERLCYCSLMIARETKQMVTLYRSNNNATM